jgi:integrase
VTNSSGKSKQVQLYGKTREEVTEKLEALKAQLQPTVRYGRTTVAAFLYSWLDDIVALRNKPRTAKDYRAVVNNHLVPRIGRIPLTMLAPEHIQVVISDLAKTRKPRTVRNVRYVLQTALSHALRWGLVSQNVAKLVETPRVAKYRIHPLTPRQARQLLVAVKGNRLGAIYYVAVFIGLRRGEIMGLRWQDIDFEGATLEVSGALQRVNSKLTRVSTKTDRVRVLPMPPALATILQEHRARQAAEGHTSEYVFTTIRGKPIDPCSITKGFKGVLRRAGLPTTSRFHDLRHTAASLLVSQGVPLTVVRDILGHTSIATTADYYSHTLPETSRQAIDTLSGLLTENDE